MKILLICTVRCGGTYLSKYLSQKYNLKLMVEPDHLKTTIDNLCVKLIVWKHDKKEILDYSKNFDYIIILDRKNIEEQTQSFLTVMEKTLQPYDKWEWNDINKDLGKGYEYYFAYLKDVKEDIKEISDNLNLPIFYYEDLYYNSQQLYDLEFKPDLSQKLRVSKIQKTTI